MTEKKKFRSFGGSPEQREKKERENRISRLLDRFETEFKVFKIRRKEDPSGMVRSIEAMLLDLLFVYELSGESVRDLAARIADSENTENTDSVEG